MKYYIHINTLIGSFAPYSENRLIKVDSIDVLFLTIRDIIFSEEESEIDFMNLDSSDLFEDLNIEISIFDEKLKNVFNLGKLHKNNWSDFENFCWNIDESVIKYSNFFESKKEKFPDVQKKEIDGYTIFVGRDSKSNDYLTFNMADKEDIWMHVKGKPGSHVVIRVRENLPTPEVIKAAALLAKKNSKAKNDNQCTVVYCQRRFVKKEPGMNDGQVKVDYKNSEEIIV